MASYNTLIAPERITQLIKNAPDARIESVWKKCERHAVFQ